MWKIVVFWKQYLISLFVSCLLFANLNCLSIYLFFAFLTMKSSSDLVVWRCLVAAIHTVLTHLTEHLVAKIYCWKMLRSGQFFRDIIYQCLTWRTPNIHSLLPLSINCNAAGGGRGDVTQNSGPPISHRAGVGVGAFQINIITSIIRRRSRGEVTLYKSPLSTSCPRGSSELASHWGQKSGKFFLLIWCTREFISAISTLWKKPWGPILYFTKLIYQEPRPLSGSISAVDSFQWTS